LWLTLDRLTIVELSGRITHDNVVLPAYTCNPPWLWETLDVSSGK